LPALEQRGGLGRQQPLMGEMEDNDAERGERAQILEGNKLLQIDASASGGDKPRAGASRRR